MEPEGTSEQPSNEGTNEVVEDQESKVTETSENQSQEQDQPKDQDYEGLVKGDDGREWIPKERLDQVLQQRNEARQSSQDALANLVETLKSDPEQRAKFFEAVKDFQQEAEQEDEAEESSTPVASWIQETGMEPAHQQHYMGFASAIADEIWRKVQTDIVKQELEPIKSALAEFKLKEFEAKVPEFSQYKKQVYDILKSGRAKNHEDAFKLAAFDDRFNKGKQKGQHDLEVRNANQKKTPVTPKGQGQPVKQKFSTFDDAFDAAWNKANNK